jgi:hypothetical protein
MRIDLYMKQPNTLASFFFAAFLAAAHGQPGEEPKTADVSFFNATISDEALYVDWSGQDAFPDGLVAGQSMGPLMIPATDVTVEAKIEGFLPAKAAVKLAAGQRTTLVFYEGPPERDKDDEKPKPRLRIYQTPGIPSARQPKEYAWPVIYVGPEGSAQVTVNGEPILLTRGKTTVVAQGKNVVQLAQGDREIAAVAVEEPSHRLFVIYGSGADLRGGVVYR